MRSLFISLFTTYVLGNPPAPCGPTGWGAYCFKQVIWLPFNALQVCKFTALQCIAILQVYKCILLNPQNWNLTALQLVFYSQNVIRLVVYCQAGKTFYPPLCGLPQIMGSPEIIPNLWKFQGPSSTPKNQKMSPEGHQQVSKWHLKSPFRHQIAESVTKVKSFKNHCIYYGLSTSSLCILATFPSLDHQKDGPGNCLPLWQNAQAGCA